MLAVVPFDRRWPGVAALIVGLNTYATISDVAHFMTHKYTLTRWDLLWTQIHGLLRNRVLIALFIVISTSCAVLELQGPEMAPRSLAFTWKLPGLWAASNFHKTDLRMIR